MVDNNIVSRAQELDENNKVIQGGTSLEIQILTCTASDMLPMNFTEIPKSVYFSTRTGATAVEFTWNTTTVPVTAAGKYVTIPAGVTLALDCAATGTYYFRNSAANQGSIVIGLALL